MWRVYPVVGCFDTRWLTGHRVTQTKVEDIVPRAAWHRGRNSGVVKVSLGESGCIPLCVGLPSGVGSSTGDFERWLKGALEVGRLSMGAL